MRWKLTLWLILLNLVVFGYLWYLEKERSAQAQFLEVDRLVLPILTRADPQEIRFTSAAGELQWSLRRDGDHWQVEVPVVWEANPFAVRRLEDLLASLTAEVRLDEADITRAGQSLADFGLVGRTAELTVISGAGETTLLKVGTETAVGDRLYVQRAGDAAILVVDTAILSALGDDPRMFLATDFLSLVPDNVTTVTIENNAAGPRRVLLTRQNEAWELQAPLRAPANSLAVEAALQTLADTPVAAWPETPPSPMPEPLLTIQLDAAAQRFSIELGPAIEPGSPLHWTRRSGSPTWVAMPRALFVDFFVAQTAFRDRQILPFTPADVSTLEIRQDDRGVRLQRLETDNWQVLALGAAAERGPQPGDAAIIERTLRALSLLEAGQFASDAPSEPDLVRFGLDQPQREVRLTFSDDTLAPLALRVGAFPGEVAELFVRRADQPFVYGVAPGLVSRLPVDPLAYRRRLVETLPVDAVITSMSLARRDATEAVWTWEGDVPPAEGAEAVEVLQAQARQFAAQRYLRLAMEDPFILDAETALPWAFAWTTTLTLPSGEEQTRTWWLTERLGGTTQFAGSERLDMILTLPLPVIEALETLAPPPPAVDTTGVPALEPEASAEIAPPVPATTPESSPEVPKAETPAPASPDGP